MARRAGPPPPVTLAKNSSCPPAPVVTPLLGQRYGWDAACAVCGVGGLL